MQEITQRQQICAATRRKILLDKFFVQSFDLFCSGVGGLLQKLCNLRLHLQLGLSVAAVDQIGVVCGGN